MGSRTELDRITRMAGSRPSRRAGRAARTSRIVLHRVPSMALVQAASSRSAKRPGGGPPVLTTRRSRPPRAATVPVTAAAGPSGVERSAGTAVGLEPGRLLGEPRALAGDERHGGALGAQGGGDRAAEAAAAPADERAMSGQAEVHTRLMVPARPDASVGASGPASGTKRLTVTANHQDRPGAGSEIAKT